MQVPSVRGTGVPLRLRSRADVKLLTLAITGAWGLQVAGNAAETSGVLGLETFTRNQAMSRLEYNF
jgi:hypothetical protein